MNGIPCWQVVSWPGLAVPVTVIDVPGLARGLSDCSSNTSRWSLPGPVSRRQPGSTPASTVPVRVSAPPDGRPPDGSVDGRADVGAPPGAEGAPGDGELPAQPATNRTAIRAASAPRRRPDMTSWT